MIVTIKHIKQDFTRDFNGLGYKTETRREWIQNNLEHYELVAEADFKAESIEEVLEDAYRFSQNLDHSWIEYAIHHKAVTTFKTEARSSSIGDIFIINNEDEYFVDSCGFSLVNKRGC